MSAKTQMIEANLRLVVSIAKSLSRPRPQLPRPDPGGLARPDPRGREVRLPQGLQVLDLRDLVDPPGRHAGDRGQGADDPDPGAHGREAEQGRAHRAPARPAARTRAAARRDRRRARDDDRARCARSCGWRSIRSRSRSRSARRRTPSSATSSRTIRSSRRTSTPRCRYGARTSSTRSASLPERERKVIELRFGLTGGQPCTLEEVGKRVRRHPRANPPDREQHAQEARVPARGARPQRLRVGQAARAGGANRGRRTPEQSPDVL